MGVVTVLRCNGCGAQRDFPGRPTNLWGTNPHESYRGWVKAQWQLYGTNRMGERVFCPECCPPGLVPADWWPVR